MGNDRESLEENKYQCIGCKSIFPDDRYVKKHMLNNMETFFCLNCDDFIKDKAMVLQEGWTILDSNGLLRRDI